MQQNMVQHAAQCVVGIAAAGGVFDCFGYRNRQTAVRIRVLRQHSPAGSGHFGRAGNDRAAEHFHERAPVRFLLVTDFHHIDHAFQAEIAAGHAERATPLSCAGLGSQSFDASLFVVISLGQCGIQLMAADRAGAFVFVVNFRRCIQRFFQFNRANQRRWTPGQIFVAHFLGNADPAFLAHFLFDQFQRKNRRQVLRSNRLQGPRVQRRIQRLRQVGLNVVPGFRHLAFAQKNFACFLHPVVLLKFFRLSVNYYNYRHRCQQCQH